MKPNIKNYLEERLLTVDEFANMTGVNRKTLYRMMLHPELNINTRQVKKISIATEKIYGKELTIWEYLIRS